jgi:mannose-P-dolichol utilization defect protein 1
LDITDGDCVKQAVTKGIGYGIIVASTLVKLPQVIKILSARSGAGISVLGVLLEVLAISFNASYSFAKKYPFTAWGESLFLLFETALIAFLVMWFDGQRIRSLAFAVIHSLFLFILMSGIAPVNVLWSLQACTLPLAVSGKMIQAYKTMKTGHTGQMSAITMWLLFLGCVARVFTSIQETGDRLIITTFAVASAANFVLVAQIHYYWKATEAALMTADKKKK